MTRDQIVEAMRQFDREPDEDWMSKKSHHWVVLNAWGAETRSSCRGRDVVLVDEPAEEVASVHLKLL